MLLCQDVGLRANIITKDAPITPFTQEIIRVWGALCQGLGMKTKHLFIIILQNHTHGQWREGFTVLSPGLQHGLQAISGGARAPSLTPSWALTALSVSS